MLHLVKLMIWDEMPEDIFVFVCLEPDNEVFLHAKVQNAGLKKPKSQSLDESFVLIHLCLTTYPTLSSPSDCNPLLSDSKMPSDVWKSVRVIGSEGQSEFGKGRTRKNYDVVLKLKRE